MISPSLIIERPNRRPAWAQVRDAVLSAFVWLLYLYMIRQLFIDLYLISDELFRWAFSGTGRPSVQEISPLLDTLQVYGIIILANGVILIVWALYNQIYFHGRQQRTTHKPVTIKDLAALYRIPETDIAIWQGSRILTMLHAADGTLINVSSVVENLPI